MKVEVPPALRDEIGAVFNFPMDDSFVSDVASHVVHTAIFTVVVAIGETAVLEALVAVFFVAPEAANIVLAGESATIVSTQPTSFPPL